MEIILCCVVQCVHIFYTSLNGRFKGTHYLMCCLRIIVSWIGFKYIYNGLWTLSSFWKLWSHLTLKTKMRIFVSFLFVWLHSKIQHFSSDSTCIWSNQLTMFLAPHFDHQQKTYCCKKEHWPVEQCTFSQHCQKKSKMKFLFAHKSYSALWLCVSVLIW